MANMKTVAKHEIERSLEAIDVNERHRWSVRIKVTDADGQVVFQLGGEGVCEGLRQAERMMGQFMDWAIRNNDYAGLKRSITEVPRSATKKGLPPKRYDEEEDDDDGYTD